MYNDEVTINKIELASEIAHHRLLEIMQEEDIYEDLEASVTHYTEEAQDIFNHYYAEYLDIIENIL